MRGINLLHPAAQEKAEELQRRCTAAGLKLLITDTLRTAAEQDELYSRGRTKLTDAYGNKYKIVTPCRGSAFESGHQWGVAFDFCRNIKGQEYSDALFFHDVAAIAKEIGMAWAGVKDMPHLELPEYMPNRSTKTLREKYGTPDAFFKTWQGEGTETDRIIAAMKTYEVQFTEDYWRLVLDGKKTASPEYARKLIETVLDVKEPAKPDYIIGDRIYGPTTVREMLKILLAV